MKSLNKYNIENGINVYFIPVKKFKTSTVSIFFHRQLTKEDATKNALLPYVLKRGCENFPNAQVIAEYLEGLYGATFNCGINKKGENQIVYFTFDIIHDQYILDNQNEQLIEKILAFAHNIIFCPVVENNAFKIEYVNQEKEKLKDLISGLLNNKIAYAVERCFQEMCRDERFSIYELGDINSLSNIDEKNLYEHYLHFLKTSPIDIFITGDFHQEKTLELINKIFDIKTDEKLVYPVTEIISEVQSEKNIKEELQISQGKLSLGFRTKTTPRDADYYSLIVYNGILGGGPHSKLFNNVREKLSLAYYVFSRLEKFKGLMLVSSGIEFENYQKALDEILAQVEEIKKGNISDYEYEATINSSINSIKSLADNAFHTTDYYLSQLVGGTEDTIEELIDKIRVVKKEDIVSVAQKVQLDTVYFLKNRA